MNGKCAIVRRRPSGELQVLNEEQGLRCRSGLSVFFDPANRQPCLSGFYLVVSFCERFFRINSEHLTHEHLTRFLGERLEEGVYLDYKAAHRRGELDYDKLSKVISGFANSAGGLLVVGVAEEKSKEGRIYPGSITWIPPSVSRERFEHSLLVRVSPPVRLIQIVPVREPNGPGTVFLVDVPQSEEPPHMSVPQHAYYKRRNFETVPMEHYEIADLFGRRRKPSIYFAYRVKNLIVEEGEVQFLFDVFVCNTGPAIARNAQIAIIFPPHVRLQNEYGLRRADEVHGGLPSLEAYVPGPMVIHRNQALRVGWTEVRINGDAFPVELKYSLVAEDCEEKLGGLLVRGEDLRRIENELKMDAPPGTRTGVSIRTI